MTVDNPANRRRSARLPILACLAAIAATLSLLVACSTDSSETNDSFAQANPDTFALPREIVVSLAPYGSVDEALQDEQAIDWLRDKSKARAITLAYAAKELRDHLAMAGVTTVLTAMALT